MKNANFVWSPLKLNLKYFAFAELGIALMAITLVAWMLGVQVEKTIKGDLKNALSTVLEGTHKAISIWTSHHLHAAERLSQLTEIREHTESLLSNPYDRNTMLSSAELQHLRKDLNVLIQSNHYKGYFIVGPGNVSLASSRDSNIGKPNLLISQIDVLDRLWSGESVVSRPLKSDVPLLMGDGMLMDGHPTMFVGAPIKNQAGHVIAFLLLRIDPFDGFIPLTHQGRLGRSGETYAFDSNGLLLTESRFNGQLENIGFLKEGEHSSLAFEIRDPGVNLLENRQKALPNTDLPLTKMAASAIKGESGIDLVGYRDYRGVPVVGAWLWDEKFNMGLTVEQGVSEAYATLWMMQRVIYGVTAFSVLCLIGVLWNSERGKINRRRTEARLDAIFNNAVDGIVVIDEKGLIERINPALLEMFGYSKHELIGENIKILTPEPVKSQHDTFLSKYRDTGEKKIIGFGREVKAQRRSGQLFPIDLSISEILVENERHFAGVIHDISDRVATEEKLNQANEELSLMAMVAQHTDNAVIIADRDGRVVWVNDGFTAMCEYSLEEIAGRSPGEVLQGTETDPQTVERIREGLRAGQKVEEEILNYKKSGEPYWVHLEVTPIFDEQGALVEFISLEHDVTERRRLLEELQLAKNAAEDIATNLVRNQMILSMTVEGAGAGQWYIDLDTGKMHWDKRTLEMFGLKEEEFKGGYSDWANIVHPDDFPDAQGDYMAALADPELTTFTLNYRIVRPNNEVRYIHVTASIERDETGEPTATFGLHFDVTEAKQAEEALQQAKEEAEAANHAKSSFLAAMSHEIRTPMNGVVGMVDVLSHTTLNEEQKDVVHTIKDSSFSLLRIIDDILDFSKIEAGKLSIEHTPTAIEEVLESVGDTLIPIAYNKGIELLLFCSPLIPPFVHADPVRLRQILFNLCGNAIKFTESDSGHKGRVLISAEMEAVDNSQICLNLKIEDNGIGMAPEVQAKLFQPFVQGESTTTRRFGGTGLGLTICRRLADLMGGRIELESSEGEGSVFSAFIPLKIVSIEATQEVIDLEGVNVLLVNSDETINVILFTYLTAAGANVVQMNVGGNVVEAAQNLSPTPKELVVIIDDYTNPGQESSLRQQFSQELAVFRTAFVVLQHGRRQSPRKNDENVVSLDIDAMHRSAFLHAVEGALGRVFVKSKPTFEESLIVAAPISVDDAKAAGSLILLAEDNETNQKVLLHQLGMLGFAAEVACDGQEALSMWRSGNYALLLTDCHMPNMDGYELARSIRREEEGDCHIPIVAITADALKDTRQHCLASGMDDYLTKPVQLKSLNNKLMQWFKDVTSGDKSDAGVCEISTDDTEAVDPTALMEVLGTDDQGVLAEFYVDFIRTFEESSSDIFSAYAAKDAEQIGAIGHRLKSSSRTVGANTLADCCQELEMAGKEERWESIDVEVERLPVYLAAVKDWVEQQYK